MDWRLIGYGIHEPWEERTKTKQEIFNRQANERAEKFLNEVMCPEMQKALT